MGYRPKFGLLAVDQATMRRSSKSGAQLLGAIVRANKLRT
jgi:beta-glucosidase